ncbi:uncharacterized protein EV154DRAFT_262165 [Mucor mucedo]|uniref:uncharacterized protein n=1 Tax=Mucor mucedo TaxID=29922 RepID=UPI0022204234|nr:uncharacterized protein EV154DRAFT_262165 [Mucor mucedo]KAI7890069.1 hypothetical protein EV154DRAFT_262165 [Mucor mucedo]
MTMGDIHKDLLQSIEKELSSKLELLLEGMVYKKRLSISRTTWSGYVIKKSCGFKTNYGLESKMVHGWLMLSKTFFEYQTFVSPAPYGPSYLYQQDIVVGHRDLVISEIYLSIIKKPPIIISRYAAKDAKITSMSKFEGSTPNCIISIDLSLKSVNVSCSNQLLDTGTMLITDT